MLGDGSAPEVGTVHVDAPELLNAIVWIRNGIKVLAETGRSDQAVNFAMGGNNLSQSLVDGFRVRNIAEVCSNLREPFERMLD